MRCTRNVVKTRQLADIDDDDDNDDGTDDPTLAIVLAPHTAKELS